MSPSNLIVTTVGVCLIVIPTVVWLWRSIMGTPIRQDLPLFGVCILSSVFGILLLTLQASPELIEVRNLPALACMLGIMVVFVPLGMAVLLLRQWTARQLWRLWLYKYEDRLPGLSEHYKRIYGIEDEKPDATGKQFPGQKSK